MSITGGILSVDATTQQPKKGWYTEAAFEKLLQQEKLAIQAGSLAAHFFIVKTKASKHFGGTDKDGQLWSPEWSGQGEHTYISFDSEKDMALWASRIAPDLYQTVYKVDTTFWDPAKKRFRPTEKDDNKVAYFLTVRYDIADFSTASMKSWKFARDDGTAVLLKPDDISYVEVGVVITGPNPSVLYLTHGPACYPKKTK